MSMLARRRSAVPKETARVARSIYPEGNAVMHMLDVLQLAVADEDFADLFPIRGQPAESPARLALVTLLQFMEGFTDRQAADAVRTRIDWKYLLCLELTDPGFDHTVLSEFRARLLAHGAEHRVFEAVLAIARDRGLLHGGGRQRSDSTHVLANVQALTRFDLVIETVRHALDVLARTAPEWLCQHVTPAWVDRYALPTGELRVPRTEAKRLAWAAQIGEDGMAVLVALNSPEAPADLRHLPALEALRQVWVQNFMVMRTAERERVAWRSKDNIPRAGVFICSPHDTQARRCSKGNTVWTGYKVHLTETCDSAAPNLITNVETTAATVYDANVTPAIHAALRRRRLLPSVHVADAAYVNSALFQQSREYYEVELIGPTRSGHERQAKERDGFAVSDFLIDYDNHRAVCPAGKESIYWKPTANSFGKPIIKLRWSRRDCGQCAMHERCTNSMPPQRQVTIRPQGQRELLHERREQEQHASYASQYAWRAGIEGTISEAVRGHSVRRTRYIGQAKTHLAHLMTAAAINIGRLLRWVAGEPKTGVLPTAFQRLFTSFA